MSKIRTPDGVSYNIHGHNGCNGSERIPHVHIMCQGKRISVSLQTGRIIAGAGSMDRNKEALVLEWVQDNLYELNREWESKSDEHR